MMLMMLMMIRMIMMITMMLGWERWRWWRQVAGGSNGVAAGDDDDFLPRHIPNHSTDSPSNKDKPAMASDGLNGSFTNPAVPCHE